jgi:hypothetical protein
VRDWQQRQIDAIESGLEQLVEQEAPATDIEKYKEKYERVLGSEIKDRLKFKDLWGPSNTYILEPKEETKDIPEQKTMTTFPMYVRKGTQRVRIDTQKELAEAHKDGWK